MMPNGSGRPGLRKLSVAIVVGAVLLASAWMLVTLPRRGSAPALTHDNGNVDIDLTDYGRILNEVRWNGVPQTVWFNGCTPPPIVVCFDDHSALTLYNNQSNYDRSPPVNLTDGYSAGDVADDYQVAAGDTNINFEVDTPALQRSYASYRNLGTSTLAANDVQVRQTAWSTAGSDWVIVEFSYLNINSTNVNELRAGFFGYLSAIFAFLPNLYGPGGDGGDDVDAAIADGSGWQYRASDNGGTGTTILFASANAARPLDWYFGESFIIDASFNPGASVDDDLLSAHMNGPPQLSGCAGAGCNIRASVGWDVGTLQPGEYVRLPLAICMGTTPANAATSCGSARTYYSSLYSGYQITEIQDEGTRRVEIFNWGRPSTPLAGWQLSPDGGTTWWSGGSWAPSPIPTNGYSVYTLGGGDAFPTTEGGRLVLRDNTLVIQDQVDFGQYGLNPDPLNGESVSRIYMPPASEYSPDFTRTQGANMSFSTTNTAPRLNYAPPVVLNEVYFNPNNPADKFVEVYYPGTGSVNIEGYKIVCDKEYRIPPGAPALLSPTNRYYYLREFSDPAFFNPATGMTVAGDNVYLYNGTDNLLDRVGWNSTHVSNTSMVRLPDGYGTPNGFNDSTSAAAGWVFDQKPTYSIVLAEVDQTKWGDPTLWVWYSVNVTNRQALPDYIDMSYTTEPMGFLVEFYQGDQVTPLVDSVADGDGIPDVGSLAPSATIQIWVKVYVPANPPMPQENTSVFASASLDPLGADRAYLRTKVNPWVEPDASASPSVIYEKSSGPAFLNESVVTLRADGRGFVTFTGQDVMFVLDSSGSMAWNDPDGDFPPTFCNGPPTGNSWSDRVESSVFYVENLTLPDRGGFVDFDTVATLNVPLTTDYFNLSYGTNPPGPWNGLWCSDETGGTVVSGGMSTANSELITNGASDHLWVAILLTDADSLTPVDDALSRSLADAAAANDIIYFTIGLNISAGSGPPGGEDLMLYIAQTTGGQYYPAAGSSTLQAIFADILSRVRTLAGRDTDLTDNTPLLQFVLQPGIDYIPGTFAPLAGAINPSGTPDVIQANPTNTTLQWNYSQIKVNEYWGVTFNVSSTIIGSPVPVNIVPDSRVTYETLDNVSITRPFPQVNLTVLPGINLLPPDNLVTSRTASNIQIDWTLPGSLVGYDEWVVYAGPTPTGIDFTSSIGSVIPTATSFTEIGAATAYDERYYVVVSRNATFSARSVSSSTVGFLAINFPANRNHAMSLPLEPFGATWVSTIKNITASSILVRWMNASGVWKTYASPGDPDSLAGVGKGYVIQTSTATRQLYFGRPGSHIRYAFGWGFAGAGLGSLSATPSGNDVSLSWSPAAGASCYYVLRSPTRIGFHTGGFTQQGPCTSTTGYLDIGGAVANTEFYYLIVPYDGAGSNGTSTYGMGVYTRLYVKHETWGAPFKQIVQTVDWYCAQIPFTLNIEWMNTNGLWVSHACPMPPGVFDTDVNQTEGFTLTTVGPFGKYSHVGR